MRISDWSSDVCSSDLTCRTDGGNLQPLPLREGYKLGQSARSTGGMEQGHGFFRHRRLQPFGIPRLRRLINIAVDDCERRRIKRSEEHTSELQSLMRTSYAVFCLKKTNKENTQHTVHF